jgi:hypothetical protein
LAQATTCRRKNPPARIISSAPAIVSLSFTERLP